MSKILITLSAIIGVASLSACAWDIGKGKGKAPPPVVEPAPSPFTNSNWLSGGGGAEGHFPTLLRRTGAWLDAVNRCRFRFELQKFGVRMIRRRCRLFLAALLGFAAAACQSEDTSPKPRFVSVDDGRGKMVATPSSSAQNGVVVSGSSQRAESVRYFVEFRSRYALSYGHSYVIFARAGPSGENDRPRGCRPPPRFIQCRALYAGPYRASAG